MRHFWVIPDKNWSQSNKSSFIGRSTVIVFRWKAFQQPMTFYYWGCGYQYSLLKRAQGGKIRHCFRFLCGNYINNAWLSICLTKSVFAFNWWLKILFGYAAHHTIFKSKSTKDVISRSRSFPVRSVKLQNSVGLVPIYHSLAVIHTGRRQRTYFQLFSNDLGHMALPVCC